ncbi:MAG: preprotein translocase subunit Sec61beta [Candidatus Nanoarchaeia archaeon]|jgi:preprotein translocase subunit Sec61beta|nr:preprotein translocase subunit Sec61beta [Candidatus Nanoarchaeia archaeon]
MADKKLPSSSGGIMQYYEDSKNSVSINPVHVIIATGILVIIVILFNFINPFGF